MVTYPLCVQEVPGSIPCSGKVFYVIFFVMLLCFLLFCPKSFYVSQHFAIPFAMLI